MLSIVIFIILIQSVYTQELIPYRKQNKWGYADKSGKIILSPRFEEAGEFYFGVAWVKKGDKYGYINKEGERVTRFKFTEAGDFSYYGIAQVKKGRKTYFIDRYGKRLKQSNYSYCGGVINSSSYFSVYSKDGKMGVYINTSLNTIHSLNFSVDSLLSLTDTLPAIWNGFKENYQGYAAVKRDSLWGLINKTGRLIVDYQYESISFCPVTRRELRNDLFIIEENGKYGFMNVKGEVVVHPKYHKALFYSRNKIAKVWIDTTFWGYIDEKGRAFFEKE